MACLVMHNLLIDIQEDDTCLKEQIVVEGNLGDTGNEDIDIGEEKRARERKR